MLKVIVKCATNLPDVDRFGGKSDPYVVISFQGKVEKTDVIKDNLNPEWNKEIQFDLSGRALSSQDKLEVEVKDWEKVLFHKLLGKASVPLSALLKAKKKDTSVALVTGNGQPTLGKIELSLEYNPPAGSKADEGQQNGEGDDEENFEEEEEEEDENREGTEPGSKGKKSKKRRKRRKRLSDKPQDFQIRVKVFKARQIPGNNVNPMVTVNVADQEQSTQRRKSTNKPEFNESFSFQFHESPAELFEKLIVFEVINDRSGLRKDTLMGYFECDIASVYDRDGHAIIRKWALLSDVDDEDEDDEPKEDSDKTKNRTQRSGRGAPAGYLKITVIVLGPGDKPPALAKLAGADDTDDVESNLLRQSGVTLQPALFSLKVFCAKDLPQMDSAAMQGIKKFFGVQKDDEKLCDPYVVFSFSGDESKSSILYKTTEPEFKQVLNLPFRFPSMCERLKIQMFDWDRLTEDDCIATSHLSVSDISGHGDKGFLPMYGPAWINFYGSPREFSELSDEYEKLNFDVGEGVAYRGRLLVELQTALVGEEVKDKPLVTDLPNQEIIRSQPYLSVTKYKLFACFYEASMVSEEDGPVEFEVSIGNYGNMLDESMAPSNTPPCNAVFDGCNYYYLPWANEKPCVCVESYWENIMFRLEALNIIRSICNRLETNIRKVRDILKTKAPDKDQVSVLFSLLDQLIADCSAGIPELKGRKNKLDRKLESRRRKELRHIADEATELKDKATDVQTALNDIQDYLERLQDLAIEPQNSIPDVIIWMLSGSNRIAYYRISACDLLYSTNPDACGYLCGKSTEIILKYPGEKSRDVKDHPELPAKVRLELWFGLEKDEADWSARARSEGSFSLYAETYENQIKAVLVWTSTGCPRPGFSDASGDLPLPKDKFKPPLGWKFDGKWYISPELSLLSSHKEAGVKTFLDDVFENESRLIPGGTFGAASVPWTDVHGDKSEIKDKITCPTGWEWTGNWLVDTNRPVDSDGWEYTVDFSYGIYGPIPKAYHMARRRRWVRHRELRNPEAITKEKEDLKEFTKEGWEYSPAFGFKSHIKERKLDFVRRRRWHCKLVKEKKDNLPSSMPPVLQLDMKNKEGCISCLPRMFMSFPKPHKYQLWAYIYQARDLLAFDDSGMNDPYARVAFQNQSQVTEVKEKTLCPTWDQTLIFEQVDIFETVESVAQSPPTVVVELFDKDPIDKDDYMGRCIITPTVRVEGHELPEPRLVWHTLMHGDEQAGQLLAACELFLDEGGELPFTPLKNERDVFIVRDGVRPVLQRSAIEILCWGVRNMKKYELTSVSSPVVEFECNGQLCVSEAIKNTKSNPNFTNPILPRMIVNLPVEEDYAPPINIKVRDKRTFGRKPVVGVHSIKSLAPYRCELPSAPRNPPVPSNKGKPEKVSGKEGSHIVDVTGKDKPKKPNDKNLDWWSKYYASIGDLEKAGPEYLAKGYETMMVFQTELEKVPQFHGFKDFMFTFPLSRGRVTSEQNESTSDAGELKGTFRIYTLPEDGSTVVLPKTVFTGLPPAEPIDCTVRVYVVKAIDLQPRDPGGSTDPYLTVTLGKTKISDKENYVPNNTNPSFGKMFELKAKIPLAKDLKITVMDHDLFFRDDLIGETVIDLENRLLSKYRATCGLPQNYCTSGISKWRDIKKPKAILEEWCASNNKSPPQYRDDNSLVLDGTVHCLDEYEDNMVLHGHLGSSQQRLALYVLNQLQLVPEHVETRPLYNKKQRNMQQGRIQLWVDIFPHIHGKVSPGPPVSITPRKPTSYVLRVIIWNTADVILQETSITGEKMSDIYVKGWLSGQVDDKQETDTHYRSMNGEGNFNWRFVFPFDFLVHEKKIVIFEKESIFSLDETKTKLAPQLNIQVWDADVLTDDFLGATQLLLNTLPKPAKNSDRCKLRPENKEEILDLFQQKSCYGWWPITANKEDGTSYLTGKVEMTLEVLTKTDADLKPAGQARDDPNKHPTLEEPKRPATSFLWFTSPFKTLKYIIWKRYKWYIIGAFILLLIVLAVALFLYNVPGYTVKKLFKV